MTPSALTSARELHSRVSDGIHVRLLWCEHDGRLSVTVIDFKEGAEFSLDVLDAARALDVFHHPYAYAAHHGVEAVSTAAHADALAPLAGRGSTR
jgi:hypothetical protein